MRGILCFLFLVSILSAHAQTGVSGLVRDKATAESLVGVNVISGEKGVTTDIDGRYRIELPAGTHEISFSYIGYQTEKRTIELQNGQVLELNLELQSATTEISDFVVVTAGKFEQNLGEVTVSMEIIKPNIIENKNTLNMDEVLQQAPGVSIVDNEPQIRSGSGYSYGAGSRVMVLVDDLPILSGDAGRPSWGFLPVENVAQIEVIKGASSVLYGSAALSGVINIRTAYPKAEPLTRINAFHGIYSDPQSTEGKYWDGNPMYTGASFLHSRRIGQFDLVIGGNVLADDSYLGPIVTAEGSDTTIAPSNYNPLEVDRYDAEKRARINVNLRYRDKKVQGLSYGINTNWLKGESMGTLLWNGYPEGLYQAYEGSATRTNQVVGTVDPFVEYVTERGSKHVLRSRWQNLDNDNDNDQGNFSDVYYGEYQFQQNFEPLGVKDLTMTAGLVGIHTVGEAELYTGGNENGVNTSNNYASYLQVDKRIGKLNISAGIRYEYFEINGESEGKPVFRSGLNYELTKGTFLRASFGQGFRFPTIAERFIRTAVGLINIYPNPELQPETSYNAEVGVKQGFKIGEFIGFIDLAYFYQEYDNFIEFTFGQWLPADEINFNNLFGLGFRSMNTGKARVTGAEVSLLGQGKIGKLNIQTLMGYTYTKPVSLTPDYVYGASAANFEELSPAVQQLLADVAPFFDDKTYLNTSSDPANNILKYRLQHLIRADVEFGYEAFTLGVSFRYNSRMQNIDAIFEGLDDPEALFSVPTGIRQWREDKDKGDGVLDLRASYAISMNHKVAIIMNNALNREYAIRPLSIEAPRTTVIQYTFSL